MARENAEPRARTIPRRFRDEETSDDDVQARSRPRKRTKTARNPDPLSDDATNDEDDEDALQSLRKRTPDVTLRSWTVTKKCIFGDITIMNDSDLVVLCLFDFRKFELEHIQRATEEATRLGCEPQFESAVATISAQRVPKTQCLNFDVQERMGWTKVESFVKNWLEVNKKDIHVTVVVKYKKKYPGAPENESDDELDKKKV